MSASSVRSPSDIPFPALAGSPGARADENPAAIYLAALADGPGRNGMRSTLDRIAVLAGFPTASAVPWQEFRFQHVAAVRSAVAATLAPATANKYLSALRGVLKASWRLGQIDTDDYTRAIDVPLVRGSRLPSGRALDSGEVGRLFAVCAEDALPRESGTAPHFRCCTALVCGGRRRLRCNSRTTTEITASWRFAARETGSAAYSRATALNAPSMHGSQPRRRAGTAALPRRQGRLHSHSSGYGAGNHGSAEAPIGGSGHRILQPARSLPHVRQRPARSWRRYRDRAAPRRSREPAHHGSLRSPGKRSHATGDGPSARRLAGLNDCSP